MPTYDYQCQACGHEFEQFQSMSAKVLRKCPKCKKAKLKRLIGTGAGVIFKGSGFWETDYRSDSYKKSAEADKKATSGDGGGESKSDSKSTSDSKTASDSKSSDTKSNADVKPKKETKASDKAASKS